MEKAGNDAVLPDVQLCGSGPYRPGRGDGKGTDGKDDEPLQVHRNHQVKPCRQGACWSGILTQDVSAYGRVEYLGGVAALPLSTAGDPGQCVCCPPLLTDDQVGDPQPHSPPGQSRSQLLNTPELEYLLRLLV